MSPTMPPMFPSSLCVDVMNILGLCARQLHRHRKQDQLFLFSARFCTVVTGGIFAVFLLPVRTLREKVWHASDTGTVPRFTDDVRRIGDFRCVDKFHPCVEVATDDLVL